jgi:arylsulfatase A-like enzyme
VGLSGQANAAGNDQQQARPNIILFLVDDMGVMDTSVPFLTDANGKPRRYPLNDFYRTPHMQDLAARGIRFSQFYAMSVCSPTRVSIATGRNSARHHTTNWINPDQNNAGPQGAPDWNWKGLNTKDVTLARLLQAQGYRTIHVGKGHFGPRDSEGADPRHLGFDINVGGASIGLPGSYYGGQNYGNTGGPVKKTSTQAVPGLEKYHGSDTFLTEALTLEANAHVAKAVEEKKPFFLYFAQYAVHAPFQADPRFAKNYAGADKPAQAKAFATLIEGMDKSLGDVLAQVESLGVAENTLVIFLGDNGSDAPLGGPHDWGSAAPLRGRKGSHYEGGMRVPFIAAWAKANGKNPSQARLPIPAGAVQTQFASVPDLFPTILAAAGTNVPSGYVHDGKDLGKLLSGRRDESHPDVFLMHYPHAPHRSDYFTTLREGDWKAVYHYLPSAASGGSHYQLFNLRDDPFEKQDLAASHPQELRRLMEQMVALLNEEGAQYPVSKDGKTRLKPIVPAK